MSNDSFLKNVQDSIRIGKDYISNIDSESRIGQSKIAIAGLIDFCVLFPLRLLVVLIGVFVIDSYRIKLVDEVRVSIGGFYAFDFANRDALKWLLTSDYAVSLMILAGLYFAIGLCYRCLMLTSSFASTIGQRLLGLVVICRDTSRGLRLIDAFPRVVLEYLGNCIIFLALLTWINKRTYAIGILVLFAAWNDMSFIIGKKISIPDLITGTRLVYGKGSKKFALLANEI